MGTGRRATPLFMDVPVLLDGAAGYCCRLLCHIEGLHVDVAESLFILHASDDWTF
jgi:hypothetical protein